MDASRLKMLKWRCCENNLFGHLLTQAQRILSATLILLLLKTGIWPGGTFASNTLNLLYKWQNWSISQILHIWQKKQRACQFLVSSCLKLSLLQAHPQGLVQSKQNPNYIMNRILSPVKSIFERMLSIAVLFFSDRTKLYQHISVVFSLHL